MILLHNRMCIFQYFIEVYLFGSALHLPHPNDIDLILVYEDTADIGQVRTETKRVSDALSLAFPGIPPHLTVFSVSELQQTRFLEQISYRRIK